jgi:hypothetical protein
MNCRSTLQELYFMMHHTIEGASAAFQITATGHLAVATSQIVD